MTDKPNQPIINFKTKNTFSKSKSAIMIRILLLALFTILILVNTVYCQPAFPDKGQVFVDTIVPRIDIYIHPDSLALIYENPDSNHEFPADFVFDKGVIKDTIANIGFRLRGNTSRYADKKSFKVSFNTFDPGRKFYGLEKMNLNGEHNDPSIMRSKIGWDLLRNFDIPATRSNHITLYINDNYYGLYINVEHIDEEFVDSRFGNQDGNLFKCLWPADLDYLGEDPEAYKFTVGDRRAYALKTNVIQDDYSDLAEFISVLNTTPLDQLVCELDKVFNVYDYLKFMAVDIFMGNWDGYIYNKNNFYLYHNTETGKFEYIAYDLDNTLGIDWMGRDWGTRDIYDWAQHGGEARPLYNRLIAVQEFKDIYSYYFNELINGYTDINLIFPDVLLRKDMIETWVQTDPFYPLDYGYTITDFHDSYFTSLSGHVTYGIKPYIEMRNSTALQMLVINDINPVIKYIAYNHPGVNQDLIVTAFIEDEDASPQVSLQYQLNEGSIQTLNMYDDGLHHDIFPGDKVYGISIDNLPVNTTIDFQVHAQDNNNNFSLMPCEQIRIEVLESLHPLLFINEFMADNLSTIPDGFGEFDDWFEIFNGDDESIWLGDKYVSDNLNNPDKFLLPDITLQPGDFLLLWADNDPEQGSDHCNFKLGKNGESIGLFDAASTGFFPIDTLSFGAQTDDISYGRNPDGGQEWIFYDFPTPGSSNVNGSLAPNYSMPEKLLLYPNPVKFGKVYFSYSEKIILMNTLGEILIQAENTSEINIDYLPKGLYHMRNEKGSFAKLIIQ